MAKTRSMTRNQNHNDDASSSSRKKRFKTYDHGDVSHWSDLDHDLLFLVVMQLGVIDFVAFGGVCKSWRSLALDNRKSFMESKPPMLMSISNRPYKKECCLEDFEGRKFKTILPHSGGRTCVGSTCGYLIFFGWKSKTRDFWLVNPITRQQLHFPCFLFNPSSDIARVRCILVFSPSVSRWVFVVLHRFTHQVWFSIAGTREWNDVSSSYSFLDLIAFKGKIYTINNGCSLCEIRLNPKPKLTFLETKNSPKSGLLCPEFVSLEENLYVMDRRLRNKYKVYELDFEEMKWVYSEKTLKECAFFINDLKYSAAIKPELWVHHRLHYMSYAYFNATVDTGRKSGFFASEQWYFPNDCLNVNLLDE